MTASTGTHKSTRITYNSICSLPLSSLSPPYVLRRAPIFPFSPTDGPGHEGEGERGSVALGGSPFGHLPQLADTSPSSDLSVETALPPRPTGGQATAFC